MVGGLGLLFWKGFIQYMVELSPESFPYYFKFDSLQDQGPLTKKQKEALQLQTTRWKLKVVWIELHLARFFFIVYISILWARLYSCTTMIIEK